MAEADVRSLRPAAEGLRVSVRRAHETRVVHVAGEIDMATAPLLAQSLAEQLDDEVLDIEVELSQVSFLGARGISVLAEAGVSTRRRGRVFRVTGLRHQLRRHFALVGFPMTGDFEY